VRGECRIEGACVVQTTIVTWLSSRQGKVLAIPTPVTAGKGAPRVAASPTVREDEAPWVTRSPKIRWEYET
jgi:hypothetical protein